MTGTGKGCVCGHTRKRPLTATEIAGLSRLRGRNITVCPICRHEVLAPRTAHDVRKLASFGTRLAHAACVKQVNVMAVMP